MTTNAVKHLGQVVFDILQDTHDCGLDAFPRGVGSRMDTSKILNELAYRESDLRSKVFPC